MKYTDIDPATIAWGYVDFEPETNYDPDGDPDMQYLTIGIWAVDNGVMTYLDEEITVIAHRHVDGLDDDAMMERKRRWAESIVGVMNENLGVKVVDTYGDHSLWGANGEPWKD